jgi:hypothetical protein
MYWTTNLMKIVVVTLSVSVKFSVMPEFNSGMLGYAVLVHFLKTFSEQYSCF